MTSEPIEKTKKERINENAELAVEILERWYNSYPEKRFQRVCALLAKFRKNERILKETHHFDCYYKIDGHYGLKGSPDDFTTLVEYEDLVSHVSFKIETNTPNQVDECKKVSERLNIGHRPRFHVFAVEKTHADGCTLTEALFIDLEMGNRVGCTWFMDSVEDEET